MALALTDEQTQLSEAMAGFALRNGPIAETRARADELAAGVRPAFWNTLVSQGFHAVHLPESVGGQGGELADAACVIDAAGYGLLPGPLLPTVIAGAVAMTAEPGPVVTGLLTDLAQGVTAAVVLPAAGQLHAVPAGSGWALSGTVGPEIGLSGADRLLVSGRADDGTTLWFLLDGNASGVTVNPGPPTDLSRSVGTLQLEGLVVGEADVLAGLDAERARGIAVGLLAAEAAGIARWCVDNVVAYLKVREQFGRPIGTFQALQHKAAMLYVNAELAAALAWDAVRAATQSPEQQRAATASAAIMAIGRLPELVVEALTMFGAVGYTWEHDLHLYFRRAQTTAALFGGSARHRALVADRAGL